MEAVAAEVAAETIDRVRAEFFANSAVLFDADGYESQRVENGRVILGWKIAGQKETSNLLHEMAHFVEIDERRMAKPTYGFRYPRAQYTGGRYSSVYYEPKTMRMTAREIRTMAFQHNLHIHFGMPTLRETDAVAETLVFMPDVWNVPGRSEAARKRWILAVYDRIVKAPKYSYAAFLSEWNRRNEKLKVRSLRAERRSQKA